MNAPILKRCHCGAPAELERAFGAFRVRCTKGCTDVYPTEQEAARAWNDGTIGPSQNDGPEWS